MNETNDLVKPRNATGANLVLSFRMPRAEKILSPGMQPVKPLDIFDKDVITKF